MEKTIIIQPDVVKTTKWYRRPVLSKLIGPVAVLIIWLLVSYFELVPSIFIPRPKDILSAFIGMVDILPKAILTTLYMTMVGFFIGTAFGTFSGLAMAYNPFIRNVLGTVLDYMRPVPVFALIPLFILWFGIGRIPQIALIALGTSVVLGVTTLEAIRNVPTIYVRAALTLGADQRIIYRTVIVPHIIPHLIGAIRVAAAASWGLDVAAEFMGSDVGLGYLIIMQQIYLRTAGIFLLVFIYSTLAVIFDTLIGLVESRLTSWTERHVVRGIAGSIIGMN